MLTSTPSLPSERALSELPHCLDPAAVLDATRRGLERVAPDQRERWREARLLEALYHPGRYVRVVYAMLDASSIPSSRAWPEGQLVYLHAPVRAPMSRRGELLSIDGCCVEAYAFPNDRRLRGLRTFARRDLAIAFWREWGGQAGSEVDETTLQRKLIRYVPEQKCVVRLRGEWKSETADGAVVRRVAVRSCSSVACKRLVGRHREFGNRCEGAGRGFVVPRVAGADERRGLLALEWLRGETLLEALRGAEPDPVLARVARGLLEFHRTKLSRLPTAVGAELAANTLNALADLSATCPDLLEPLETLRSDLPRMLASLIPDTLVTLHNDFHWNQFSIKRDRLAILDLERIALGDELVDVANFATQLQMLGLRPDHSVSVEVAERWRAEFLSNWRDCSGREPNGRRFHLFAARSRLELARGVMRHLRPGWGTVVGECVTRAVEDVARARERERVE